MISRWRDSLLVANRLCWLALSFVTSGCVPDVPVRGGESDAGMAPSVASDRGDITKATSEGPTSDGASSGPVAAGSKEASKGASGNRAAADPGAPGDDGTPADPMPQPQPMPYACQADSDCAESLVCRAQECAFIPPERVPSATVQTAGGGLMTGSGMRLQLRIGAPPPTGRMRGSGMQLTLGPLAGY